MHWHRAFVVYFFTTSLAVYGALRRADCDQIIIAAAVQSRQQLNSWVVARDMVANIFRLMRRRMGITRRSADMVLEDLNLMERGPHGTRLTRDLRNLRIADIGAGRSNFGSVFNAIEEQVGTHVYSIDRESLGSQVPSGTDFVQASAFHLPFADRSMDLTVSNWMVGNMMGNTGLMTNPRLRERLQRVIDEMIRITDNKGEVRFTIGSFVGRQAIEQMIRTNRRAKRVRFVDTPPLATAVIIELY
jgi:Methyltransferase domain